MSVPRSVRFDADVAARLSTFVAARPGWSGSSAADRLVDEGLRMQEHPGVVFRDGPTGRRAALAGGPDVWEVVRDVQLARTAEPTPSADEVVAHVSDRSGLARRLIRIAVAYWAAYPDEIDERITRTKEAEATALERWTRERDLLNP